MRVSARAEYAVRAAAELAGADDAPVKGDRLAEAQAIPPQFLEQILLDLKRAGIVRTRRGREGGYWLARPPAEISLADVIRAVEGPLANVQGAQPQSLEYTGHAAGLQEVWIAVRASIRNVLETVTLQHLAEGKLPESVRAFAREEDAWLPR